MSWQARQPAYELLDDPDILCGFRWIASLKQSWRMPNGKPNLIEIAQDAGINKATLYRVAAGGSRPTQETIASLSLIAAEAAAVSPKTAQWKIFKLVVPAPPAEAEELSAA